MTTPPPLDVEARRPVWTALSEFWLDTEMSSHTAYRVVRTVLESPYSVDQAEAIHWAEVAPALFRNLYPFNVAGEWAGFDEDWLAARCAEAAVRRPSARRTRWLRWFAGGLPDVVLERARRAEREGLPPMPDPTGPFVSLTVSERPLRYRVPW